MQTAGARALREDDNAMSREAVLLQWERKIEAAERLESEPDLPAAPALTLVEEPPAPEPERFVRAEPPAERRTITITGQPTPPRRRRTVVEAQLAQPDRIALWAFLLGLLLVAVAAGTAHG
jgi:hypothetical protein